MPRECGAPSEPPNALTFTGIARLRRAMTGGRRPSVSRSDGHSLGAPVKLRHSPCAGALGQSDDRRDCVRTDAGPVRASEGPDIPVHDRNVGALFLLRDAHAARPLHGQASAAARAGRDRDRLWRDQGRAGVSVRAARRAAAVVTYLRPVQRVRVSHARDRRADRRSLAGTAPHRDRGRNIDGDRPFHDGVRTACSCSRCSCSSSATAPSSRISRPRSAASTRRAIRGATAPSRSSMSGSISVRSFHRWSAARWAKPMAGITASRRPASAC